jgi:hypothetical protein
MTSKDNCPYTTAIITEDNGLLAPLIILINPTNLTSLVLLYSLKE